MKTKQKLLIDNRKANFNYTIQDEYEAGIVLIGCEIKSIRKGNVNMSDAYCTFENGEMFLKNMHISPYEDSGFSYRDYQPKRDRKLLLTKHELRKLNQAVKTKGKTIIPVKMYVNDRGYVKLSVALAVGKHTYDKSKTIKERDLDREMRRNYD